MRTPFKRPHKCDFRTLGEIDANQSSLPPVIRQPFRVELGKQTLGLSLSRSRRAITSTGARYDGRYLCALTSFSRNTGLVHECSGGLKNKKRTPARRESNTKALVMMFLQAPTNTSINARVSGLIPLVLLSRNISVSQFSNQLWNILKLGL